MHLVNNSYFVGIDLDPVDQQSKQAALGREIGLFQSGGDLFAELVELTNDEPKLFLACRLAIRVRLRLFLALQTLLDAAHPRGELVLVHQSVLIDVDQSAQPTFQVRDGFSAMKVVDFRRRRPLLTPLQFAPQPPRILQQCAQIGPNRLFQGQAADALVLTDDFAGMAILVGAKATVVKVTGHLLFRPMPSVVGTPANVTDQQTAQQKLRSRILFAIPPPVLCQAFGHGGEQFLADQRGSGNRNLLFGRSRPRNRFLTRNGRGAPLRPTPWNSWESTNFAEFCRADIRRVDEDASDRRRVPTRFAGDGADSLFGQTSPDLAQRYSLQGHPGEHLAHVPCVVQDDIVARLAVPFALRYIAIPIGRLCTSR